MQERTSPYSPVEWSILTELPIRVLAASMRGDLPSDTSADTGAMALDGLPEGDFFGVIAQLPGASGRVTDWSKLVEQTHERHFVPIHPGYYGAIGNARNPVEGRLDIGRIGAAVDLAALFPCPRRLRQMLAKHCIGIAKRCAHLRVSLRLAPAEDGDALQIEAVAGREAGDGFCDCFKELRGRQKLFSGEEGRDHLGEARHRCRDRRDDQVVLVLEVAVDRAG